jgi:phenylpyruvate tautomerase PptA (4-oxalocrotonate tautomerase family)
MVRVLEFSTTDFFIPNVSERYVLVEISLFSGRSIDVKRQLYKQIVTGFSRLGVPKDEIRIILNEVPAENWGLRGGQAGCDLTR